MSKSARPALRLVRERKIGELITLPQRAAVLEASGVEVKGGDYFVVFDNIRRAARIGTDLAPGSPRHAWVGHWRSGEGYEDVSYSVRQRRFYLLIEAEKHPDGTYKAVIEECDDAWRFKGRRWIDVPFDTRNRGFEGLTSARWRGVDYLLALCEGNRGKCGREGREQGGGRIHVLKQVDDLWQSVAVIKLPRHLDCKDYSALSLRGTRLAVVSQQSASLWIGTLRPGAWTIAGAGKAYDLPRTKKGKRRYFTVEGLAWLSANTFAMVSDLRKRKHPDRAAKTDQSIHIFRVPPG